MTQAKIVSYSTIFRILLVEPVTLFGLKNWAFGVVPCHVFYFHEIKMSGLGFPLSNNHINMVRYTTSAALTKALIA